MDEASVLRYITDTFEGLDVVVADGNAFFFYDPDRRLPHDRRFPFATLVTNDDYDAASDLDRPSVFRLNIGIGKQTYRSMFDPQASPSGSGDVDGDPDFKALDRIMPHPVYGSMYWVCVLSPGPETFQEVKALLAEALELAAKKYARTRPEEGP